MSTKISLKTQIVRIDGWRSRREPINAICAANDTGMSYDSPCPSNVCKDEIKKATAILKSNGIKYKTTYGHTSNVFCIARYIVVSEDDKENARNLLSHLVDETRLLYLC